MKRLGKKIIAFAVGLSLLSLACGCRIGHVDEDDGKVPQRPGPEGPVDPVDPVDPDGPENPPASGDIDFAKEGFNVSSVAFVKQMGAGWNLGNTLDANDVGSGKDNIFNTEISWGAPETTQAMIKAVKAKGFKTIRIPVSWHNHITDRNGYKIDSKWMARVKQIVDWSIGEGLYVIINIHHDNYAEGGMSNNAGYCITDNSDLKQKSMDYMKDVWTQVANTFIGYDSHLIFEALNEPRAVGTSDEWWISDSKVISKYNKLVTDYEQVCVNTIRATGGRNAQRFIMVPPYVASVYMNTGWELPYDSASDKLLISVHAYTPNAFALSDASKAQTTFDDKDSDHFTVKDVFDQIDNNYMSKGRGVVMGEASCSDKNNLSERKKWFNCMKEHTNETGISVVLWDNMVVYPNGDNAGERHGYLNRTEGTWYFQDLVNIFVGK